MLRRLILVLVVALSSFLPFAPSPLLAHPQQLAAQRKDCVVYVTRTGHRYHMTWCRYLRQSKIPMSRSKAIAAGFTPCRVCGGSNCER
jgi:hypothetical protein